MATSDKQRPMRPLDHQIALIVEKAKQELEGMIDANPQSMLLLGSAGTVARANRAALDLLGLTAFDDVLGKRLDGLFDVPNRSALEALGRGRKGLGVVDCEQATEAGVSRLLRFTVVGEPDADGLRVVLIRDLSAEAEEAKSVEMSHKQEAMKALMVTLMHRLNQPLTVLLVQAKLLYLALEKGQADPDEVKKGLEEVMSLSEQISDILKRAERTRDYLAEPYLEGPHLDTIEILRLDESE